MNWYLAKIVYRIVCGSGHHLAQFDEQLRLVGASSRSEALEKALGIGRQEEESFRNQNGQLVEWQFLDVTELHPLGLIDGAEVSSRINEVDDTAGYLLFLQHKAGLLREELDSFHPLKLSS